MTVDRRTFVAAGGAAALGSLWNTAACAAIVRPEQFGARGDGRTDDTRALQRCLDLAPRSAVVQLRTGAVYRIDTNWAPTQEVFGGIKLKSGQVLDLNGAELRALPTESGHGSVVQARGIDGWRIEGPGRITGEKSIHRGHTGEWGMGIAVFGSDGWTIGPGVEVNDCWGDGIYVDGLRGSRPYSRQFTIDGVHIWNCRRNGISVIAGDNGEIRKVDIHDIAGTNPQGAIDLEPDDWRKPNRNIRIRNGKLRRCQVGVYVTVGNENILITEMTIEAENSGIIASDHLVGLQIIDNPHIASTGGGAEGAAIRTVTQNSAGVRHVQIRRNVLRGGGFYVIDILGNDYVDTVIANNRLYASSRGVQGIARVGKVTYTDNVGVIERVAGKKGEFFVQFDNTTFGRNSYRNLSPNKMWPLIRHGGKKVGEESYSGLIVMLPHEAAQ